MRLYSVILTAALTASFATAAQSQCYSPSCSGYSSSYVRTAEVVTVYYPPVILAPYFGLTTEAIPLPAVVSSAAAPAQPQLQPEEVAALRSLAQSLIKNKAEAVNARAASVTLTPEEIAQLKAILKQAPPAK